jgi:hypothetical protein
VILAKPSSKAWGVELSGHPAFDVLGHDEVAALVTLDANLQRHIEENRMGGWTTFKNLCVHHSH